jgi:EAL domain-containing protein (putative c-di-GMP-specific phosphodiesterase class I)
MRRLKLSRVTASVFGLVGLFLLVLIVATASLLWSARQADLANSEAQALRFVSSAETALNRSLLGVDVLLASMDELLGLSQAQADWIDTRTASRLMYGAIQQNLIVRYVALLDGPERIIASSEPTGAALAMRLPDGFAHDVLAQPVSALMVSAPVVSLASGERVLYLGRHIKLGDSARVLVVAEVPILLLTSILIQGVDISELEVTLERGDGQLLASVPDLAQLSGQQLTPALGAQPGSTGALWMSARVTGVPAMVITRPTLYRDVLIAASIPIDAALAKRIAEKILQLLNQPYQLATYHYHSTPSIGVTLLGDVAQAPAELLKQADIAMYQVKSHGRNALCFFDPQMQSAIIARAQLEQDLQAALTQEQFELYYQPQFEQEAGLVGAEVRIRWHHPLRGLVPPMAFIGVAEESELILSIGQWVLRTACEQLSQWQADARCRALHLSVNVSARQFRQRDFVARVAAVMHETGVRPHLLKLELTESLVHDNMDDTIAKMSELKALGVRFSMDDFGTGYSSLAYLTRLPMDQLKIDQSFVRNIGIPRTDGVIVQTIIGMARNLELEVIAEGVETLAQQEFLALHGCTLYQGYLFGKPAPLAQFEALLTPVVPCTPN